MYIKRDHMKVDVLNMLFMIVPAPLPLKLIFLHPDLRNGTVQGVEIPEGD